MMKFFEDARPQVYFDGGRLSLDKKTGKQIWSFKMVIDLKPDEVTKCDDVVLNNYIAIETRENCVEEIVISHEIPRQQIEFFGLEDHTAPLLWLQADIVDMSLSREEDVTSLHFKIETENTDLVHGFVRRCVFTRFWAEFNDVQRSLPLGEHPAMKARKQRDMRKLN